MIRLVKLYRRYISPIKQPSCRFTPTCSQYAIEAFTKRGFFAGMILTVWRILRCNPFCRAGYDPVPERGFRNPPEIRALLTRDGHRHKKDHSRGDTDTNGDRSTDSGTREK